ncbi:MAG TPA: signal peptide peptidase SppA [Candidatus Nanoarchaeia archaeon]|nr:signal peptide peptidase SppA [Candidatus Nanoarchaeia archaeon]
MKRGGRRWIVGIIIAGAIILFLGIIAAALFTVDSPFGANTAVIEIKGEIMGESSASLFGAGQPSSSDIVHLIEEADENPAVRVILLEINSPGGSAVASQEVVEAIKNVDAYTVAWIREQGTSGAYWVASAADHIIASPLSITGSIGVLASYLQFSGLLQDYNVTYERVVGGKYKDIGSPFKPLTPEERVLFQSAVDELHDYFLADVAENRGLPLADVRRMGTGIFYTGKQAQELGLVDELGGKQDVIAAVEDYLGEEASFSVYQKQMGFFESLAGTLSDVSFMVGKGIGETLLSRGNALAIST